MWFESLTPQRVSPSLFNNPPSVSPSRGIGSDMINALSFLPNSVWIFLYYLISF